MATSIGFYLSAVIAAGIIFIGGRVYACGRYHTYR